MSSTLSCRLQSKLPAHLRTAAAAASGGVQPPQPQQPASITVDFGSPDSQQQPQQRQVQQAAVQPPRAAPAAAAGSAPKVAAVKPAAAAAAAPTRAAANSAPAAGARGTAPAAPAAGGSSGGLPSRLAGRLGPPLAATASDEQPDTRRQVRTEAGRASWFLPGCGAGRCAALVCLISPCFPTHVLSLQPAKRLERESEASEGGTRAPRRRAGGALGFVVSALHDALGADAPVESAVAAARVSVLHACILLVCIKFACDVLRCRVPADHHLTTRILPFVRRHLPARPAGFQRRRLSAAQAPAGQRV